MFIQNHINAHCINLKLQHYDQKQPNHAYLSNWLVAQCPGLNAAVIEGWLFIRITISPLKYLKTISILQKLITVLLKSMVSRVCKTIYLLILQHPLAGIMCRCPVCFRPGVSAVKVKIEKMDKNRREWNKR